VVSGLVTGVVAGCAADDVGETDTTAWSTKDRSIVGRPPDPTARQLDAPPIDAANDDARRAAALEVLSQGFESPEALVRANTIEALHAAPREAATSVRLGLADENRGVRFVAVMTVGELQMAELCHLVEPLLADPSPSVRAAAIYAMRSNGLQVDPTPLGFMLRSGDPEVKANAAMILGELGDRSAVPMLKVAKGQDLIRVSAARARLVDLQIAEALVRLGEESELEGIRAGLFAPPEQGELTALACLICGRLDDKGVVANLLDLASRTGTWQQSPEVRMAATMGLAGIEPTRAPLGVPLEYASHERDEVRAQAALTLGAVGRREALSALESLLHDRDPLVQVSAAAAILQIVPE
jgi:HEAT repeat protein